MEQQIKMAAKLYKCRDTAKRFYKKEFNKTIEPYKIEIKQVMEKHKTDEIKALLKISETKLYQDSGMAQMLFMAAMVELIEPSAP